MRQLAIAAIAVLLVTSSAYAESKDDAVIDVDVPSSGVEGLDCPTDGYKSKTQTLGVAIPDGPNGSTGLLGPIQFIDDGLLIEDVIIDVDIEHTWTGDLIINVYYDVDCTGANRVGPVALLCRADLDGCSPDDCCGCSSDLVGTYRFSDGALGALGEPCPGTPVIPNGCYLVAPDSPSRLIAFEGYGKGGCWYIEVIDGASADTGILFSWTVYLANTGPTPVEASTWGSIKSIYQD